MKSLQIKTFDFSREGEDQLNDFLKKISNVFEDCSLKEIKYITRTKSESTEHGFTSTQYTVAIVEYYEKEKENEQ